MLVLETREGGGVTGGGGSGDDGRKLLNGRAVGVVTGVMTAGLAVPIIVVTVV